MGRIGILVAVASVVAGTVTTTACDDDTRPQATTPSTTLVMTPEERPIVLGVALRTAIENDPDGRGAIAISYELNVADVVAVAPTDWDVTELRPSTRALDDRDRTAIETALAPATVQFVDPDEATYVLAEPVLDGASVVVAWQHRCGGDPDALCGSGGALRLARSDDGWQVVEVVSSWIS